MCQRVLPGNDDGIVSRASGELDGMKQLIELTAFHTTLPLQSSALTQAQHFIEDGKFTAAKTGKQGSRVRSSGKPFRPRKR